MVKPKTCIRNIAPISDRGMVTTGMMAERIEPRKEKDDHDDDQQGLAQGLDHLLMAFSM
jgi:hypothetical protein